MRSKQDKRWTTGSRRRPEESGRLDGCVITAATEDQGRVPAEQTLGEIILSVLAALFPDIHYLV